MSELVKAFFKRDLTTGEEDRLEAELEASCDISDDFTREALEMYRASGQPEPKWPGTGNGPAFSAVKLLLGVITITGLILAVFHLRNSNRGMDMHPVIVERVPSPVVTISAPKVQTKAEHIEPAPVFTKKQKMSPLVPWNNTADKFEGLQAVIATNKNEIITVRVLDSTGREVRHLYSGIVKAGKWVFEWDARVDNGEMAGPGRYAIEVQTGEKTQRKSVVVSERM